MKKLIAGLVLVFMFTHLQAQELNSRVQVLAPKVTNINKRNLDLIQKAVRDFLNNNKFTAETYQPQERIECNFVITINTFDGNSNYSGEAQIQSSRPVFNATYNSTLLNMTDKNFDFSYNEGQALDFSDQNFISNLSAMLTFYAYTIIGLDKDSFSKFGGTPYYTKAQNIVNLAQNSGGIGWKAADGLRNRYWLNENLLNISFRELRTFIYEYHRNGLDKLQEEGAGVTKNILAFLDDLQKMGKQKLGSIFPNVYFASKADEIVDIFSIADVQDRIKAYNQLAEIDPANTRKYEALRK